MDQNLTIFLTLSFLTAALAFAFAAYLYLWVKKQSTVNTKIIEVSALIKQGANTFMNREYRVLARFALVAAVIIFLLLPSPVWKTEAISKNILMAVSYIVGTVLSAIAGKIGILVATLSNARCAESAQKGIKPAFLIGFRGGAVMGLLVVGCSLLGVAAVLWIVGDASILLGFSFGASSLALFAKAGGGIFTKTADVSADLTGKVELGIPEDDPRNPAVIADNVGDNVGDVAGMGADLFDSNVAAMTSAIVIAQSLSGGTFNNVSMVFCYAVLGLLSSIIGIGTARIGKNGSPTNALNSSTYVTTGVFLVLTAFLIPKILRLKKEDAGVYKLMYILSNIAFYGIPVVQALFGSEAVLLVIIFTLPFQFVSFTFGVAFASPNKEDQKFSFKMLTHPMVIASLIAYALYLLNVQMPQFVVDALNFAGQATSPGAMVVVGTALAYAPLKKVFLNWRQYVLAAIKMVVLPVVLLTILRLIFPKGGANDTLVGVAVILMSMPTAANCTMLTSQYGGDYETASSGVFLTTLLSAATIPFLMWLLQAM